MAGGILAPGAGGCADVDGAALCQRLEGRAQRLKAGLCEGDAAVMDTGACLGGRQLDDTWVGRRKVYPDCEACHRAAHAHHILARLQRKHVVDAKPSRRNKHRFAGGDGCVHGGRIVGRRRAGAEVEDRPAVAQRVQQGSLLRCGRHRQHRPQIDHAGLLRADRRCGQHRRCDQDSLAGAHGRCPTRSPKTSRTGGGTRGYCRPARGGFV